MKTPTKQEIVAELWKRGNLSWLLKKHQLPIYNKIKEVLASDDPEMISYFIACSRQYGKSFCMFLIAVENCLKNPKQVEIFVAPLKSQVNEIIRGNTFSVLFASCPKDLIPRLYQEKELIFKNGARIRLAGTDNKNYENIRGGACHNIFLDEACFMSDLNDGVLPAFVPMTTTTGGKVIYASTPPASDHDSLNIMRDHDESGLISTFTIYDDKTLTENQLLKITKQCGGNDTIRFKREYLCQRIVDNTQQVVPMLTSEKKDQILIDFKPDPLHNFWCKYVVLDTGVTDKSVAVFAHYNYRTKQVVVEDTIELQGEDYVTSKLATMITDKVRELWGQMTNQTIRYIADSNNKIVIQDLNLTYRLPFVGTSKGRLHEMVQKVNDWIYDDRITFAKPAEEVLNSTHYAVWDKQRTAFGKSAKYGHYDALAAMVYLVRNIDETTDPVPRLNGVDPYRQLVLPTYNPQQNQLNGIFGNKSMGLFRK